MSRMGAIGARVLARYGDRTRAQEVTAQSDTTTDRRPHRLGTVTSADDDTLAQRDVEKIPRVDADQLVVIREGGDFRTEIRVQRRVSPRSSRTGPHGGPYCCAGLDRNRCRGSSGAQSRSRSNSTASSGSCFLPLRRMRPIAAPREPLCVGLDASHARRARVRVRRWPRPGYRLGARKLSQCCLVSKAEHARRAGASRHRWLRARDDQRPTRRHRSRSVGMQPVEPVRWAH